MVIDVRNAHSDYVSLRHNHINAGMRMSLDIIYGKIEKKTENKNGILKSEIQFTCFSTKFLSIL